MNDVFKLVSLRPAQQAPLAEVGVRFARYDVAAKSPLHQQIEELTGDDRRAQAIRLAMTYMDSDDYVSENTAVVDAVQEASTAADAATAKEVAAAILNVNSLAEYLQSEEAINLRNRLWDSLYAQTIAPDAKPGDRNVIYAGVRAFYYLAWLVEQEDGQKPMTLDGLQRVKPMIPTGVVPPATLPAEEADDTGPIDNVIAQLKALYARVRENAEAKHDLLNVDRRYRSQLLRTVPNADVDLTSAARTELSIPLNALAGPVLRVPPAFVSTPPVEGVEPVAEQVAAPAFRTSSVIMPAQKPWVYEEFGQTNLSETTKAVLNRQRATFEEQEPADIIATLEDETNQEVAAYLRALPVYAIPYVVERDEFRQLLELVPVPLTPFLPVQPLPLPAPGSPAARGIRPLGIGDLLVVQQNLLGYAPGEVAHIENILKSEHKNRVRKRLRETEEILTVETEEREETERDLQSTERFELQKETERTVETEMSVEAGLSVTASYGFVSATATANFAYNQSRSEANRVASQFVKEVVDRSVSRIMQRVREERTRRTLERFEETNEHGFDNSRGDGHVVGIYRWVDKYYTARTVNYGRRLMMEFIVPEPGAFYIYTQDRRKQTILNIERPVEPTASGRRLRPDDLTRYNYQQYVSRYNVQDIAPYPAPTIKVGAAFAEAPNPGENKNADYAKTFGELLIPDGYRSTNVYGILNHQGYDSKYFIECFVAGELWPAITAYGLEKTIPISVKGWFSAFHLNLVAQCELKAEAKAKWQLEVFQAIMNAYEQALADYNEDLASAEIQAGVEITGHNPAINRKIERDELKKGVLRLLTNEYAQTRVNGSWRYNEQFNAMKPTGAFGYPEFDVSEAMVEGQIIQFFEQAFEWNNMTYRFYPYLWGRKGNWKDTFGFDDPDPQFADFLRAGAGRVIVPVHPAYDEAILHYLYTNEIWNGDQPPTLDDPLYVSIVTELKADSGADINRPLPTCADSVDYPCVVDEWEVKVPTDLVYLQTSSDLPGFVALDEGNGTVTMEVYIVQRGETWVAIAQRFGVSVRELQQANPGSVRMGHILYRGERLLIPRRA
jgi:hypothetical protein